jgi:2-polyprenyl-3-methyl-5-hydroxy-6-metoxy-1,4-benzoquinol methylase
VGSGFVESDDYYRFEKERYWRSLELLCQLDIPLPSRILEIGGGQLAVLCKKLFADDCTVADISQEYVPPLRKAGIEFATINLLDAGSSNIEGKFDLIVLLEVIEHIPIPAYVVIDRIKAELEGHYLPYHAEFVQN